MAARASGKIFTARRCCHPRKWHFQTRHPPATACGCTPSAAGGSGPLPLSLSPARASGKIFTARRCFNPRKWHFRTRHPPATPRGCALPLLEGAPPPFCPPREATVKKIFLGTWIFLIFLLKMVKMGGRGFESRQIQQKFNGKNSFIPPAVFFLSLN